MSIAINTHGTQTTSRRIARAIPVERAIFSSDEQLRVVRGLIRHFMLAFTGAGLLIYAAGAAGLTF